MRVRERQGRSVASDEVSRSNLPGNAPQLTSGAAVSGAPLPSPQSFRSQLSSATQPQKAVSGDLTPPTDKWSDVVSGASLAVEAGSSGSTSLANAPPDILPTLSSRGQRTSSGREDEGSISNEAVSSQSSVAVMQGGYFLASSQVLAPSDLGSASTSGRSDIRTFANGSSSYGFDILSHAAPFSSVQAPSGSAILQNADISLQRHSSALSGQSDTASALAQPVSAGAPPLPNPFVGDATQLPMTPDTTFGRSALTSLQGLSTPAIGAYVAPASSSGASVSTGRDDGRLSLQPTINTSAVLNPAVVMTQTGGITSAATTQGSAPLFEAAFGLASPTSITSDQTTLGQFQAPGFLSRGVTADEIVSLPGTEASSPVRRAETLSYNASEVAQSGKPSLGNLPGQASLAISNVISGTSIGGMQTGQITSGAGIAAAEGHLAEVTVTTSPARSDTPLPSSINVHTAIQSAAVISGAGGGSSYLTDGTVAQGWVVTTLPDNSQSNTPISPIINQATVQQSERQAHFGSLSDSAGKPAASVTPPQSGAADEPNYESDWSGVVALGGATGRTEGEGASSKGDNPPEDHSEAKAATPLLVAQLADAIGGLHNDFGSMVLNGQREDGQQKTSSPVERATWDTSTNQGDQTQTASSSTTTLTMTLQTTDTSPIQLSLEGQNGIATRIILQSDDDSTAESLSKTRHDLIASLHSAGIDTTSIRIDIVSSMSGGSNAQTHDHHAQNGMNLLMQGQNFAGGGQNSNPGYRQQESRLGTSEPDNIGDTGVTLRASESALATNGRVNITA